MKRMTSREIRDMWLKYFSERGHMIVPSANLIPKDDDTLLWINAGVTPLKRYFDGSEVPISKRITNIQKCIRTNDIENVGITKRHQTFFEMMGNFSVGDYFKNEAKNSGIPYQTLINLYLVDCVKGKKKLRFYYMQNNARKKNMIYQKECNNSYITHKLLQ